MKRLSNLSIPQKIVGLAGVLLALMVVMNATSFVSLQSLTTKVKSDTDQDVKAATTLVNLDRDFYQAEVAVQEFPGEIAAGDGDEATALWEDYTGNAAQVLERFAEFEAAAQNVEVNGAEDYDTFKADFAAWQTAAEAVKAAAEANDSELLGNTQDAEQEAFTKARDHIDVYEGYFDDTHLASVAQATEDKGSTTGYVMIVGAFLGLVLGSILAFFVSRSVASAVRTSARKLVASSQDLASISTQLGSTANSTVDEARSVSEASDVVTQNVQAVAAAIEEMEASIREIATNASEANRVANEGVIVAQETSGQVSRLGDSSREIGKVLEVITSIAEQTNLLALNATIEAARAGDAGKGFAVVANEVKELAKETASATEDIAKRITAIQSDTTEAAASIANISTVIDQVNGLQGSIAGAVEEQTATVAEIARNVATAADSVGGISDRIRNVAAAAEQSSEGAARSEQAASELRGIAEELASDKKTPQAPSARGEVSAEDRFGYRGSDERSYQDVR